MSDSDQKVQAPNYAPVIDMFNQIGQHAADRGAEAYNWAKGMVDKNTNLTDFVNRNLTGMGDTFDSYARDAMAKGAALRDNTVDYLKGVRDRFTDPMRRAADMGAAGAGAAQASEAARDASTRELESYGVNPGATRFGALDIPARLQSAAMRVGAENIAGRQDEIMADNANSQLLGQSNTDVGQGQGNAGIATGSRNAAVNNALQNTQSGYTGMGTDLQWTQPRLATAGGVGNTMNNQFANEAAAAKQNNDTSSGLGSLLGLGASALGSGGALSGAIPGLMAMLEEGGAVDDIGYAGGGAVPVEMSPSGGAAIDDVPAVAPGGPARLNAGEFVMPRDATAWYGEKFMQGLIAKARKERDAAVARPQQGMAPPPGAQGQGAVPMRA